MRSSWRGWVAAIIFAAFSVTPVSAVWHAGHEADADCAICKLPQQPLADLHAAPQVQRHESGERLSEVLTAPPAIPSTSSTPARAPPLG
jgi:hypothetical protein